MTAGVEAADLFLAMMRQVLPVQGSGFVLDLDKGPVVEQDGWLSAPVVAGLLDERGELMEAQTGAVTLLHLVDVGDSRGRAFLAGWRRALERMAEPFDSREVLARAQPSAAVIEDLRLRSEDDFADALAAARWLDSAPDWIAYPSLEERVAPVAADAAREVGLAARDDDEGMLDYLRWLEGKGDPRGTLGLLQSSTRETDRRLALRLLRERREYFLGGFPLGEPGDAWRELELEWSSGFIRSATARLTLDPGGPAPAAVLRALFALPVARFLRELVLEVEPFAAEDASHHALHSWTDALDVHSDSLRRLVLARDRHVHDRPEDEDALRARFPLLMEIVLVPARDE